MSSEDLIVETEPVKEIKNKRTFVDKESDSLLHAQDEVLTPTKHQEQDLIDFHSTEYIESEDLIEKDEDIEEENEKQFCRIYLNEEELNNLTRFELYAKWKDQDAYIDSLEAQLRQDSTDKTDLISLRESEEKLKLQQLEATRRENILVMRLTTKEQEMQEYVNKIEELKQAHLPGTTQLQTTLLDPAVNLMFERMKKEVDTAKAKVEEMQNELSAWKFTPDSNTGKRLMAKCRLLYQENEELGKLISSGRVAKLEGDLALQKTFSEEMKKSQSELDEFLLELDEDVEGMQNTIYYLQQQLKESKERIASLHLELNKNSAHSEEILQPSSTDTFKPSHDNDIIERTNSVNDEIQRTNNNSCNNEHSSFESHFDKSGVYRTSNTSNGPNDGILKVSSSSSSEATDFSTNIIKKCEQSEAKQSPAVATNLDEKTNFDEVIPSNRKRTFDNNYSENDETVDDLSLRKSKMFKVDSRCDSEKVGDKHCEKNSVSVNETELRDQQTGNGELDHISE